MDQSNDCQGLIQKDFADLEEIIIRASSQDSRSTSKKEHPSTFNYAKLLAHYTVLFRFSQQLFPGVSVKITAIKSAQISARNLVTCIKDYYKVGSGELYSDMIYQSSCKLSNDLDKWGQSMQGHQERLGNTTVDTTIQHRQPESNPDFQNIPFVPPEGLFDQMFPTLVADPPPPPLPLPPPAPQPFTINLYTRTPIVRNVYLQYAERRSFAIPATQGPMMPVNPYTPLTIRASPQIVPMKETLQA